jgi:hypothetical protein
MPGEAAVNLIKLFFLFVLSLLSCVLLSFIARSQELYTRADAAVEKQIVLMRLLLLVHFL